jgi:hypothetical protein
MSNLKTDTITPLGSTITVAGGITVGSNAYFSSGVTVAGGLTVGSNAYFSSGVTMAGGLTVGSRAYFSSGVTMASTLQVVSSVGLGLTASPSTSARLHVYGSGTTEPYGGANLGTAIVSNADNTRQLQMGTTTGGVWIEGWLPGVGGATMALQPSGGSVAISTTTVTTGFRLEVGGAIRCTSVTQTSDRRAKEDIVYLDSSDSLGKIMQLNPCEYTLKQENKKTIGFIADEVQSIIPVAVNGEPDSPQYQGIDYTPLFTTLLSAVQELSKKINAQAEEIADLKTKVNP